MKEVIDKLDFIKIKNLCSVKATAKKMRRQDTDLGENSCKRNIW